MRTKAERLALIRIQAQAARERAARRSSENDTLIAGLCAMSDASLARVLGVASQVQS